LIYKIFSAIGEDFRGIAISSVISKVFEHCILDKFLKNTLLAIMNNLAINQVMAVVMQFFAVRKVVERLNKGGSTANICAIDLSKAFAKVNHCALYIKLVMEITFRG